MHIQGVRPLTRRCGHLLDLTLHVLILFIQRINLHPKGAIFIDISVHSHHKACTLKQPITLKRCTKSPRPKFTSTITYTYHYVHLPLRTPTITYTYHYVHVPLRTPTITYTYHYVHLPLRTPTVTYCWVQQA